MTDATSAPGFSASSTDAEGNVSTPQLLGTATESFGVEIVDDLGAMAVGLRQEWMSHEGDGLKINLTSGAGVGSPYMLLTIKRDGHETIHERVDMSEAVQTWIDNAINRADAREDVRS